jgi:hypothetical protein
MNRREKLLMSLVGPEMDETKVKMLDTTIKFILGDMGSQYLKFWKTEGPGVMVFQPLNKERSMFFLTLKELHSAEEESEKENKGDLAESFRRILEAAKKIDPDEKAGYIVNDEQGMRYFEIDYNNLEETK